MYWKNGWEGMMMWLLIEPIAIVTFEKAPAAQALPSSSLGVGATNWISSPPDTCWNGEIDIRNPDSGVS